MGPMTSTSASKKRRLSLASRLQHSTFPFVPAADQTLSPPSDPVPVQGPFLLRRFQGLPARLLPQGSGVLPTVGSSSGRSGVTSNRSLAERSCPHLVPAVVRERIIFCRYWHRRRRCRIPVRSRSHTPSSKAPREPIILYI